MISTKILLCVLVVSVCLNSIGCPPVIPEAKAESKDTAHAETDDETDPILNLEYHRYLKEVVNLLESDKNFKELIEKASPEDIKSGKISSQLQFVEHNIRTKLDELKRKEVDRMRQLIGRKARLHNLEPKDIKDLIPKHIDQNNIDTFEEKDLESLIKTASNDLEEHDRLRRAEFKEHELNKEYERRKHLEVLDETARKKAQDEHEKNIKAQRHHEKVNHPGSKDQLEKVWDEEDELEGSKFDPETFFQLHDTDGNGFLDEFEIEALFQIELDKVFNSTNPEYDPIEREEEMNRMREHVFKEMDKNQDKMISMEEFINETQDKDFDENEEWKGVEDEDQFDEKEFEDYSRRHQAPTTPTVPMHRMEQPESPKTVHN